MSDFMVLDTERVEGQQNFARRGDNPQTRAGGGAGGGGYMGFVAVESSTHGTQNDDHACRNRVANQSGIVMSLK